MNPRLKHPVRTAVALTALACLLIGCSSGDDPEPDADRQEQAADPAYGGADDDDAATAAELEIVISGHAYEVPDSVPAGAEVTVTNNDSEGHTVTSDDDGIFDVAVGPGETVTFTVPDEPGSYGFFCIPHPNMTATLVVE